MERKRYRTGEFAKKANVSIRTIHFYEKKGLIHPAEISENGYRYYSEEEFARLQRILTLKLLGFSLEDIQELSLNESNTDFLQKSFEMQQFLVRRKIEHLQTVEKSIQNISRMMESGTAPDWDEITRLIRIINMDRELVEQYQNGKNIDARIALHSRFSQNPESWFRWIYENMGLTAGMNVLELGCGNGMFWCENADRIPTDAHILLTDISTGMIEDTKANLSRVHVPAGKGQNIHCQVMDCHEIDVREHSMDIVLANFLLFYVGDLDRVLGEIHRIIKADGTFICATYGENHMKEVQELVQEFHPKIRLSGVRLYENFGLENGEEKLRRFFQHVRRVDYQDFLKVTEPQVLMDYILSCHGNQREYLVPAYDEFQIFLEKKFAGKGYIEITKQAGIFIASQK